MNQAWLKYTIEVIAPKRQFANKKRQKAQGNTIYDRMKNATPQSFDWNRFGKDETAREAFGLRRV